MSILNFSPKSIPLKFILFSFLLSAVIFIIENINHDFWLNDFRVYYYAAEALLKGHQVYGTPFGLTAGYYKYSPFALFFFVPYTALPYYTASVVHTVIISICFVIAVLTIRRIVTDYLLPAKIKSESLFLSLIEICVLLHVVREMKLGNINIILIMLLSLVLFCLLTNKAAVAGIMLGLCVMFKPYLIVLIIPIAFHKNLKALLFVSLTLVISFLVPLIVLGPSAGINLHKQWLGAIQAHSTYLFSNHTIQSIIKNNIYATLPSISGYFILALSFVGYLFLFRIYKRKEIHDPKKHLVLEYFTLLSVIPNLLITDTEQFLYSLPLIVLVMGYLWVSARNYFMIAFFVVIILLYGGNSSDLLGKNLSGMMESSGMLGLSNLCIIGLVIYIYFKSLPAKQSALDPS